MAKYRETPCKYYVAFGECTKGREASPMFKIKFTHALM